MTLPRSVFTAAVTTAAAFALSSSPAAAQEAPFTDLGCKDYGAKTVCMGRVTRPDGSVTLYVQLAGLPGSAVAVTKSPDGEVNVAPAITPPQMLNRSGAVSGPAFPSLTVRPGATPPETEEPPPGGDTDDGEEEAPEETAAPVSVSEAEPEVPEVTQPAYIPPLPEEPRASTSISTVTAPVRTGSAPPPRPVMRGAEPDTDDDGVDLTVAGGFCGGRARILSENGIVNRDIRRPGDWETVNYEVEEFLAEVHGREFLIQLETAIPESERRKITEYVLVWTARLPAAYFTAELEQTLSISWLAGNEGYAVGGEKGAAFYAEYEDFVPLDQIIQPDYGVGAFATPGSRHFEHTFIHEMAHVWTAYDDFSEWETFMKSDGNIVRERSDPYNPFEDFAEFAVIYWYAVITRDDERLAKVKKDFPARAAHFDRILAGEGCMR